MTDHPSNKQTDVEALFTYHPPRNEKQLEAYREVRNAGKELAVKILAHCPPCADRTAAVRKVREAVMTANAAIALEPEVPEETAR